MPSYYCDRCRTSRGWQGFHVCFDASKPEPQLSLPPAVKARSGWAGPRDEAYRKTLSEAQQARWAKIREAERPRDLELVEIYNEGGVGVVHLGKKYGISKEKVLRILHEAEAEGRTVVRARGHTLAKGA